MRNGGGHGPFKVKTAREERKEGVACAGVTLPGIEFNDSSVYGEEGINVRSGRRRLKSHGAAAIFGKCTLKAEKVSPLSPGTFDDEFAARKGISEPRRERS